MGQTIANSRESPDVGSDEYRPVRAPRVLTNAPGIGVARHVDAGYDEAVYFAGKAGGRILMKEVTSEE